MPRKYKLALADMTVKAEDCYNPEDYIMVHKDFLAKMRKEISRFHNDGCICMYCKPVSAGECR